MKFSHLLCCLLLFISCKKTTTQLTKIKGKNITVDSTISSSTEINNVIAPYKKELKDKMEKILSFAPKDFTKKDGEMQSSLGNLIADLSFEMANPIFKKKTTQNIDFAMFNSGGMRAPIPQGNVPTERAFKIMPFENEMVVVTLTGKKVSELVDYFIRNKKSHPLSKNIALTITDNGYQLKINGKPFDKNKNYTVLTSDYLQGGGDRMIFFKDPVKLEKLDYKVRDAIIDYFKKTDTLKATIDKRVIIK